MKNLIKAIETEQKNRLDNFILEVNAIENLQDLKKWQYDDLLPKGKNMAAFTLVAYKAYLIDRKQKAVYKSIERDVKKINAVSNEGILLDVKISIEWKRSAMWGSNPKAECWYSYTDKDGNYQSGYVVSGSIGGCGYDKQSTAVADCLNQINEVLKPLYLLKDKSYNSELKGSHIDNRSILSYGSGYGILPSIEGGVGVSCYPAIFNAVGYDFKTIASGKTYDVYTISKIN